MSGLEILLKERESIQQAIDFLDNELKTLRIGGPLYHYAQTTKLKVTLDLILIKEQLKEHLN